jgi:hypothetical protein
MQEKKIHRMIVSISLGIFIVSTLLFIYSAFRLFRLSASETINDWLVDFSGVFSIFSTIALMSAYAIKFREKRWLKIAAKSSLFLVPLIIALIVWRGWNSGRFSITEVSLLILFTLLLLTYINLYSKATALAGNIVFLFILVLGMFLKRNHLFGASFAMIAGSGLLSLGSFMFAIRCIYLTEDHSYFRNMSFFGGIIMSISFLGLLIKLQHWPGSGPLLMAGLVLLILGTVFLLFTLHTSGIIEWSPAFKKIFLKLLIPWTFIFFIYFSRFLIPDLYDKIWSPDQTKRTSAPVPDVIGFGMKDYEIEKKNGLGSED